ncbi:MAG: integrase domain-containing protein [Chlorobium sp.]|nr:integrase domain-containing protein [Chlorobium sp.]
MKPLTVQALEKIGKDWSVASLTREAHLQNTKDFASFVADKFSMESIANLKPGHVTAYVKQLVSDGISNGTICNRLAAVRELAAAVGKANIVARDNKAYGVARGSRQKPVIQNSAEVNRIRVELVERANAGDRIAIMAHAAAEMRDAFGLRAKESLMSFKLVDSSKGAVLRIEAVKVEGTKGGRERNLPIQNEAQLRAIQQVDLASKALGSGTGRCMPPEMSLKEAYNAQRTLWRSLGGTKAAAANMHSSRHKVAQEMYAKGISKGEIMERLGHGSERSPFCYIPK